MSIRTSMTSALVLAVPVQATRRANRIPILAAVLAILVALPAAAERPTGRGACCLDGKCSVGTAEDCEAQGGLYLGDRTNCGQVNCGTEVELDDCETALANAQIFPGDGAGSGPDLSYTDNLDGTITDNNTGFMWEVKVAGGGGCLTDLHAVDATCDWNEATGAWIDELNAEGGTGYAGYSDWRFPNLKELQSIVDYGVVLPSIDPSFPGATASSHYWSATSDADRPSFAWYVLFSYGYVLSFDAGSSLSVRAVRGGP